jgi:ribosomal 30S subunit maturation factor RimM
MGDEYITLARVLKTQGRRGEVAVELHSDVPDRFVEGMRLFALDEGGQHRQLQVEVPGNRFDLGRGIAAAL